MRIAIRLLAICLVGVLLYLAVAIISGQAGGYSRDPLERLKAALDGKNPPDHRAGGAAASRLLPADASSGADAASLGSRLGDVASKVGKAIGRKATATSLKVEFSPANPANPRMQLELPMPPADESPVAFGELLLFLKRSRLDQQRYILDKHDCKHFSHELLGEARKMGLPARMILISLVDEPIGHAITAFLTSDRGIVYVDFTPVTDGEAGRQQAQKNLVFVAEGRAYRRVPVGDTHADFGNREIDFSEREIVREDMLEQIARHETKLRELDAGIASIESRRDKVKALRSTPGAYRVIAGFNNEVGILVNERDRLRGERARIAKEIAAGEARGWTYAPCDWITERVVVLPAPFPQYAVRTIEPATPVRPGESVPVDPRNDNLPPGMSIRHD